MSEQDGRTQHCECGNDTYHIKWAPFEDISEWAECAECGRPTAVFGDGLIKQRDWYANRLEEERSDAE